MINVGINFKKFIFNRDLCLFIAYLLFYIFMFLNNNLYLAYDIFIYIVIPIAIFPEIYLIIDNKSWFYKANVIGVGFLSNLNKTLSFGKSRIFISLFVYTSIVSFSSIVSPKFTISWFVAIIQYFLSINFFLLITARLCAYVENFINKFFIATSVIVAANAAINIYYHIDYSNWLNNFDRQLIPSFGHAPDHWPTTACISYSVYFIGSFMVANTNSNRFIRFIMIIASTLLLVAMILTQSRGGLFSAFISIGIYSFFSTKRVLIINMSLTVLFASMYILLPKIALSAITRGNNFRFEIWRKFSSLIYLRPLLGYGERIEFSITLTNGAVVGHAHNIFISALTRGGLVASAALIFAFVNSIHSSFRYYKKINDALPLCLILTVALASTVDFDLIVFLADWQWSTFWMPLGICIGLEKSNINKN